jgi:hypothetical protein
MPVNPSETGQTQFPVGTETDIQLTPYYQVGQSGGADLSGNPAGIFPDTADIDPGIDGQGIPLPVPEDQSGSVILFLDEAAGKDNAAPAGVSYEFHDVDEQLEAALKETYPLIGIFLMYVPVKSHDNKLYMRQSDLRRSGLIEQKTGQPVAENDRLYRDTINRLMSQLPDRDDPRSSIDVTTFWKIIDWFDRMSVNDQIDYHISQSLPPDALIVRLNSAKQNIEITGRPETQEGSDAQFINGHLALSDFFQTHMNYDSADMKPVDLSFVILNLLSSKNGPMQFMDIYNKVVKHLQLTVSAKKNTLVTRAQIIQIARYVEDNADINFRLKNDEEMNAIIAKRNPSPK